MSLIKEKTTELTVKKVLSYVEKNPDKNIIKIIDILDKLDVASNYDRQLKTVRTQLADPHNNWSQLVMSLYSDIDDNVRTKLFENFILNAAFKWAKKSKKIKEQYQCNVPWTILLDPTSACNLHCTGCWAAEYGNRLNLSYEEIDDLH